MKLPDLTLAARLGVGAVAALALAGGGAAIGAHLASSTTPTSAAGDPIVASPSTQPAPAGTPNPAVRAVAAATLQAEAQALGVKPKQVTAALRSGTTLQQQAQARGMNQAQFQSAFMQDLRPLLDRDVTNGTITQAQEQTALERLATTVPNWSQVRQPRQAGPSPSPATQQS